MQLIQGLITGIAHGIERRLSLLPNVIGLIKAANWRCRAVILLYPRPVSGRTNRDTKKFNRANNSLINSGPTNFPSAENKSAGKSQVKPSVRGTMQRSTPIRGVNLIKCFSLLTPNFVTEDQVDQEIFQRPYFFRLVAKRTFFYTLLCMRMRERKITKWRERERDRLNENLLTFRASSLDLVNVINAEKMEQEGQADRGKVSL